MDNETLLRMLRNRESLSVEQLQQLEESGLIQLAEDADAEEAKNTPYSDLVSEWGFDDEDGEPHDTD